MPKERYVTRAEIAELLGVEERTITNWIKKHPEFAALTRVRGTSRTFPVQKCLQWDKDRAVADAISSVQPPAPDDMYEAERRRAIADAELAEIKVAKAKGELVDASAAAHEASRTMDRIGARLRSIPGEFAPQITAPLSMPEAVAILRRLVVTALSGVQADFASDADDDPSEPAGDDREEDVA
jgi:phage terminase Nu1 subunit (DNA packaging protein)